MSAIFFFIMPKSLKFTMCCSMLLNWMMCINSYSFQIGKLASLVIFQSGVLPNLMPLLISMDQLPASVNIPIAISKKYPLPQEELMRAYNKGNVYLTQGLFDEALKEFNMAAEISPDTADVFLSRGIVEEKLLKWQDAIDDYRHANDLYRKRPFSGDDPVAMSNLANAETGLEMWADALRDYTYASRLRPDFVAPQLGRAFVLYQLGSKDESAQYFRALTEKYPSFADAQAALAVMLYESGDKENALGHWEDALEEDSRYQDLDWVANIRRWPPRLVEALQQFKSSPRIYVN